MVLRNIGFNLKGIEVKSNFFFAPINTGLAINGNPSNHLINFHKIRSNGCTGINYVGNTAIDCDSITNHNTLYVNPTMHFYPKLAETIQENDSIPGIQIACFSSKFQTQRRWVNSSPNVYTDYIRNEIKNLTTSQIRLVIKSFQQAMQKLAGMGFRVLQLHGAHGYFLNNFLSRNFNHRTDAYGKDPTLIIKEILDGVNSVCQNTIIDLRISLFENDLDSSLNVNQLNFLEEIYQINNIDIISISNGIYNLNKKLIYPDKQKGNAFMMPILQKYLSDKTDKLWNVSGNIVDLDSLINHYKHITYSIGRSIIADPEFLTKSLQDKKSEIIYCEYKNKCHYFSLNKDSIECGVNTKIY